jgi:hypothetical protein
MRPLPKTSAICPRRWKPSLQRWANVSRAQSEIVQGGSHCLLIFPSLSTAMILSPARVTAVVMSRFKSAKTLRQAQGRCH